MTQLKKSNLKGSLILILASLIWGLAFVVQSHAADLVPPFLFNSLRSFVAALFLLGILALRKKRDGKEILPASPAARKRAIVGGTVCGILLAISVNFQQFGIAAYPAGAAAEARAGFITALYVVIVPLIALVLGQRLRIATVGAVLLSVVGIYLLCLSGGIEHIYLGDVLVLLCAIAFSFHIVTVDRLGESVDGMLLSALQFAVCGILSGVLAIFFERATLHGVWQAMLPILYMGIFSSGIGYTLQIYGQRYAEPAVASLAMSPESVFAALGGWLILGNKLTLREFLGCTLVFLAIVLAQLPQLLSTKKRKNTP